MVIDTDKTLSITEVNHNFSRAVRIADKNGDVIIYKRNRPKYILINLDENPLIEMTDEEKTLFVGQRILRRYIDAFRELAK